MTAFAARAWCGTGNERRMQSPVCCTKCQGDLASEALNPVEWTACPHCGVLIEAEVFPALFKTPEPGQAGDQVLVEGESSCFYHPQKKAVVPCDLCGRFLCALCDVELDDRHFCPACLESGKKKGQLRQLENQRVLYDRIALFLATLPLLLCLWPSLVGAPMALFVALRYRNYPTTIRGGSKVRFWVAGILAVLQIIGWIIFFVYLASR